MTPIVMDLDVFKVGRLLERFIIPIEILEPSIDIRVIMLEEISNLASPILVQFPRQMKEEGYRTLMEPRLHLK